MWDQSYETTIWPYWTFSSSLKNTQNEYKLSWNSDTIKHAPSMFTNLPNVYIGSVIVHNRPVVSQEMACLNGRTVASHILTSIGRSPLVIYPQEMAHSSFLILPRLLDECLLRLGYRHIEYNIYTTKFGQKLTSLGAAFMFLCKTFRIKHAIPAMTGTTIDFG